MQRFVFSSVVALVAAAGIAQAGTITISGDYSGSFSTSAATVGVNGGASGFFNFGNDFRGTVTASNILSPVDQQLALTLTSFTFNATTTKNVTIVIEQDYTIDPSSDPSCATGSHQLNGNLTLGQGGSLAVDVRSRHENTDLPTLLGNFTSSTNPLNIGQGQTTVVGVIGNVYTIRSTYNFSLTNGTLFLPDSGVDNATFCLVPLPAASWAGMGSLGLLGAGMIIRRRRNNRA
jgi:hypothetical protein